MGDEMTRQTEEAERTQRVLDATGDFLARNTRKRPHFGQAKGKTARTGP
jgi:hypothetical protein